MFILTLFFACMTTVEEATNACYESCETQQEDCDTIDMDGCRGLCDWVVATIEDDPKCLRLGVNSWSCDVETEWECSEETDIVGQPIDSNCEKESLAFEEAGCAQEE